MSSPDPFSARFDTIAVDPANAPSAEAIDRALAFVAPSSAAAEGKAGFFLMNDAGGRFVVDREMGVITVASDLVLTRDAGQTHTVRLKVIEASGAHYELEMALIINGRVPQMVGAEDLFGEAPPRTAIPAPPVLLDTRPPTPWTRFAVMQGMARAEMLGDASAPFGAMLTTDFSCSPYSRTELRLRDAVPAPAGAHAIWSI